MLGCRLAGGGQWFLPVLDGIVIMKMFWGIVHGFVFAGRGRKPAHKKSAPLCEKYKEMNDHRVSKIGERG